MPHALSVGVPYDLFWHLNPTKLESFNKAFLLRRKYADEEHWMIGKYVLSAVGVAVDHVLSGSKASSEYFPTPLLEKSLDKAIRGAEVVEKEEQEELLNEFVRTLNTKKTNFEALKKSKAAE